MLSFCAQSQNPGSSVITDREVLDSAIPNGPQNDSWGWQAQNPTPSARVFRLGANSGRLHFMVEERKEIVRADGRGVAELRAVKVTVGWLDSAEGSALIEFGNTRVLCAASFTEGVPRWKKDSGSGWVTAEYAMLPRATHTRSDRESVKGKVGGRTHEISRLIGRALRAAIDVNELGENTIVIDCDVLQADGGTRTAAITGAFIALAQAVNWAKEKGIIAKKAKVIKDSVAAISVGIIDGVPMLDLPYSEDVRAETDMNVVVTGSGHFVEVQGTAEGAAFDRSELNTLLDLALKGTAELTDLQKQTVSWG